MHALQVLGVLFLERWHPAGHLDLRGGAYRARPRCTATALPLTRMHKNRPTWTPRRLRCYVQVGDEECTHSDQGGGMIVLAVDQKFLTWEEDPNEKDYVPPRVFEARPFGSTIEAMRFSPDDRYLAVGGHDMLVDIFSFSAGGKGWARVGRCSGHSSTIKCLDWSLDGARKTPFARLCWRRPAARVTQCVHHHTRRLHAPQLLDGLRSAPLDTARQVAVR